MQRCSLSGRVTEEAFLLQIDLRLAAGETLAEVGKPFGACRQQVFAWKIRRIRPSRHMLTLAEYVWTYGRLEE